ncbi:helix-turn-helix domain-containing protein [Streptomyces noursei]|uniref:helix-turn-helix domain-containing protein n=1 Tax=Streptomyces noursei TaxID=1971 RepID=UPI00167682DF|nr:helix-turn-helix transcriptional regulator [Streptomyces noursei]MCZ1015383.1 helix-turn-helix transcriptional regulator [Streptomyces noursei]GGX17016.1 transcriptional regulator [Streptomyces noursei]
MEDSSSTDNYDSGKPEPSGSLRTFGAVYQGFRENAGFTQEALAPVLRYSAHYIGSVEQGRRLPSKKFIDRSEEALGANGVLRKAAKRLSKQPGLARWFREWAELEKQAINLYTYECRLVPGLLQSEPYARTLFENRVPLLSEEEVETQVAARLERQKLLRDRPNTAFSFVIDEHVFRRPTGGADTVRGVIDHVLECMTLRNVDVQVMPLERGIHPGLDGPMQLLETPDNQWFGYCEGQESSQFITDPQTVSTLYMRYAKLLSQALTPEDSGSLLKQIRGAL